MYVVAALLPKTALVGLDNESIIFSSAWPSAIPSARTLYVIDAVVSPAAIVTVPAVKEE